MALATACGVKNMRKLSSYFHAHYSSAFKIAFTVVFILVNLTVVLVNTFYVRDQIRMQNDSLVEMVEHLSLVEDNETVITYLTHYGHTHRVFLRYKTMDGAYEYETATPPDDYEIRMVEVGGEDVAELQIDNAQSNLLEANATYLLVLNGVLIGIYAAGMLYFHQRNKRLNRPVLQDLSAIEKRIHDEPITHDYRIADFHDIDEALRAASERNKKLREEHQRSIQTLAHDIKTPLTILEGTLEGIRSGRAEDESKAVEVTLEETGRINTLVERIIHSDETTFEGRTSLTEVAGERLRAHEDLFDKKGVALRYSLVDDVEVALSPEDIKRLVEHLLLNAYNHVSEGGEVSLTLQSDPPTLIVSDDGEGMDEDTRRTLFDEDRGMGGVGMLIVKNIVEKLDGDIEVESEIGKGTTVSIYLHS